MSEGLYQLRPCRHLSSWPVPTDPRPSRCGASGSLTHDLATEHGLPNGSSFGESGVWTVERKAGSPDLEGGLEIRSGYALPDFHAFGLEITSGVRS
jgi:hypothetical protein